MKVPPRCVLAVKHLWLACLILNIDKRHSTNSPASNVVPVPLVSPSQGERWKGQWRRSSGTRLGVEWVDPKDAVKNEEYGHSCSEGSDKTCMSIKTPEYFQLACYSICLGPRTEKPLMAPQVASQHKTAAYQRGLQLVCATCQPCQGPVNIKHSCV